MTITIFYHRDCTITLANPPEMPKALRYALARLPPRYPMPAIPLSVGIGPEFVDVCSYSYFYGSKQSNRQCWGKIWEYSN